MLLIPGIELRKGHIAIPKPFHDKKEDPLQYLDPFETVTALVAAGAQRIHVIDADGAQEGEPVNLDVVQHLHKLHPNLEIEVTGGIKKINHAELWLDVGAQFVVLTWKIMKQHRAMLDLCGEYPGRIIVSVEGRHGTLVSANGENVAITELLKRYEDEGVSGVFYSEMHIPGDRTDPLPIAAKVAAGTELPVVCNGGLHAFTTAKLLRDPPLNALRGVVIGRALLTGGLDFRELMDVVEANA